MYDILNIHVNTINAMKCVYGFDIATDNGKYMAYKISDLVMNVTKTKEQLKELE